MVVDLGNMKSNGDQTTNREPIEVDAAFMVVVRDGRVQASPDINAPIVPRRETTLEDMYMAASQVVADIQATKTAGIIQAQMQQTAQQIQQQAENQNIMNNLKM